MTLVETINFRVDSSLGELDVWLNADTWVKVEMCDPSPDIPIVEEIVRSESDLGDAFTTLGLPAEEAKELAEELWEELEPQERAEREAFLLPGDTA